MINKITILKREKERESMSNLLMTIGLGVKGKCMRFLYDERGEVNIVTTVVLIGIAVMLALLFKEQIGGILKELLGNIQDNATSAMTEEIS